MTRTDLADLVEYAQRQKRMKCAWMHPRCIGRAVQNACTCEAGVRDHEPRDVVEAWGRGYSTVGHYLAARERGDLLPFERRVAPDPRPSAPVIPLRPR